MADVRDALRSNVQHVFGVELNRVDPKKIDAPAVAEGGVVTSIPP